MKKALAILSALALVATAATAEVKVGGWGRIGYDPISGSTASGSTVSSYTEPSWANGARVGVNFSGSSDNIGFNLNLDSDGATVNVNDQAKIWVKLNDAFKFELGRIQGDVLRGKIGGFGVYNATLTGEEDNIFARFRPEAGILLDVTPVEGVYLGAALDTAAKGASVSAETSFKKIQVGAGYTIANVGLARAQFIGSSTTNDVGDIQVAFNLTAVKGLNAEVGARIDLASSNAAHYVIAGATYSADALSVGGRVKADIASSVGIAADLNAQYTVAAPAALGLNVSFANASSTTSWAVGPYARLSYSQGYAAVGFKANGNTTSGSAVTWSLPIFAEYWF